jgi:putative PIN family toxin of toxin-antitoxin system
MSQRAVFDCMVFLQGAMRTAGPAAACFRLVDGGVVELCVSAELLAEVKDVLARPSLQRQYKTLAPANVAKFMAEVEGKAILIPNVPPIFSYARDPKDEPYVNLAAAAGARYLVTRDKDLLDLMDESTPEGRDFRHRFPGLTILDPPAFFRAFASKADDTPPAAGTSTKPPERQHPAKPQVD